MPVENFEEEGLAKNPDLQLAQWKFMLSTDKYKNDNSIKAQLTEGMKAGGMCNHRIVPIKFALINVTKLYGHTFYLGLHFWIILLPSLTYVYAVNQL